MVVYRMIQDVYSYSGGISRNEYIDYKNNIISSPAECSNDGWNTHNYKPNIEYLHFFHFYEDAIQYISNLRAITWDGRTFIALYDIPNEILDKYKGFGFYPENLYSNIPVLEYAIPYSELSNSFIIGEIIKYKYCKEKSKEYMEYVLGGYNLYLEGIDENDKKLIKCLTKNFNKN